MAGTVLSNDDLDALRAMVGSDTTNPTDNDLDNRYYRLGSIHLVALEVLNLRLTTLLNNPAQFSVPGYSENNSANIAALRAQIADIQATADRLGVMAGYSITSAPLERLNCRR